MKKIHACIFAINVLMVFSILSAFEIRQVQASDFVTETSDYIVIENDYFIANFSKGWHGRIKTFYIKPDTTVNIVCTEHSPYKYYFLGGHEIGWRNGTYEKNSADWNLAIDKSSQTTSVVYESTDLAIVESKTVFGPISDTTFGMTVVEYYLFYAEKEYYVQTMQRTFDESCVWVYNYEDCFLFDRTWASTYYTVDHDGTVFNETDGTHYDELCITESKAMGKYPWAMMYNTTYSKGFWSILLSAHPMVRLGQLANSAVSGYTEYQVLWHLDAVNVGDTTWAVLLNGVASDSDYVDDLATSLYSTDVWQAEDFDVRMKCGEGTTTDVGNQYRGLVRPSSSDIIEISTPSGANELFTEKGSTCYMDPYYKNATDEYKVYDRSESTVASHDRNSSYAKISWQNDYDSKIRFTLTTEMWADSDVYYMTWNFTTLATINATWFKVRFNPQDSGASDDIKIHDLGSDVYKANTSGVFVSAIEDEGIIFQNLTIIEEKEIYVLAGNWYYAYWFPFKAESDQEIASGTSYHVKLKMQPFLRYNYEGLGYFGVSDILDVGESSLDRHHKLAWNPMPLMDTGTPFRIKNYGEGTMIYAVETSAYDNLDFTSYGQSGTTTVAEIYTGNKRKPSDVYIDGDKQNEGSTWTWIEQTLTATLSINHQSARDVAMQWGSGALGIYPLTISVVKNGFPEPATVFIEGENKTVFGVTSFKLTYGNHFIIVYCGDERQTKSIFLSGPSSVGFDFSIDESPDLSILGWTIPVVIIVIVGLYFLLFRKS